MEEEPRMYFDMIGGSRSSGYITKLIAENNVTLSKIKSPSNDLIKRFPFKKAPKRNN
jgi:hypothetical protein